MTTQTTSAPAVNPLSEFSSATLECDLVMKGGITSGVVYPPAVLALAQKYRFRSVGGTSAGAIAAALTAAAESNREGQGFERLQALGDQLGKGTFLLDLFQPSQPTRPLMRSLLAFMQLKPKPGKGVLGLLLWFLPRLFLTLLRNDFLVLLVGSSVGAALSLLIAWTTLTMGYAWQQPPLVHWLTHGGVLVVVAVACLAGMTASVVHLCLILVRRVPENTFGMCSGRRDPVDAEGPDVLTDWLSAAINHCAGRDAGTENPPLTFRDLFDKKIELRMITSNLSHGQSYGLPFEMQNFLFKHKEMMLLFPPSVVKHLMEKQHQSNRRIPPAGFSFLPAKEDFPVIVATRMSLSFPLLISAVPLYTVKATAYQRIKRGKKLVLIEDDLQRNVFSDGGICSNFPIHFFDEWLPIRPTFGINLTAMPNEAVSVVGSTAKISPTYASSLKGETEDVETEGVESEDKEVASEQDVFLPRPNEYLTPEWRPINDMPTFLRTILNTALSCHDNAQALLPSYRERIIHIRFADNQGGLNLAMDESTVRKIKDKGKRAGEALRDQFIFDRHRWVRFRFLMGLLDVQLLKMQPSLHPKDGGYYNLLNASTLKGPPAFAYPRGEKWCQDVMAYIERLRSVIGDRHPPEMFDANSPRPGAVLRVTPNL
jgi:predicted acylesterase/phospholipase RssA